LNEVADGVAGSDEGLDDGRKRLDGDENAPCMPCTGSMGNIGRCGWDCSIGVDDVRLVGELYESMVGGCI
jgi:hypothetical protein